MTDEALRNLFALQRQLDASEARHRARFRRLCTALGVEHATYEAALDHAVLAIEHEEPFLLHLITTVVWWTTTIEEERSPEWARRMLTEAAVTYRSARLVLPDEKFPKLALDELRDVNP